MNAQAFPQQGLVRPPREMDFRSLAQAHGMVIGFAPSEFIFREGDAPRCLYLVLKGSVQLLKKGRTVGTVHEGETVGTLSVIDGRPSAAAARAKEPCELVVLDEQALRSMVRECPSFVWFVLDSESPARVTRVLQ